jgi:hypothetical protein
MGLTTLLQDLRTRYSSGHLVVPGPGTVSMLGFSAVASTCYYKIPLGESSRTVNQALRIWAQRRRRRDAVVDMDALRTQLPKVSTDEVVRWIREDREHGH